MKVTRTEDVKGEEVEFLKKTYLGLVKDNTPDEIRDNPIFDLSNKEAFKVRIDKEKIEKWQLWEWFENYEKEAMVSTAGIRGAQNVRYPWDTRFPLNQLGVALATLGKAMVLKEELGNKEIHKVCSGEVRYNTSEYIEIISRIQAAQGIKTHLPVRKKNTSIWMVSFLIFMFDYDGGEYVTSSHAMSSKIATKDLDDQGSQFIPEMSAKFVKKIKEILIRAEKEGFDIELSAKDSPLIVEDIDGIDLYLEYLRNGIATDKSIDLIKEQVGKGMRIMYDPTGGCMFEIMDKLFNQLGIFDTYEFNNIEMDPFFHGIGKMMHNPITNKDEFFDWGCDTTMSQVIVTVGYEKLLKDKEPGYPVIMVDPDGDRIVIGQVEPAERKKALDELGIRYIDVDSGNIFTYYTANQAFFLIMNFHATQLREAGIWNDHPRFLIMTTPSASTWSEWAEKNDIKVIEVPVGFKEIATIMKKVEKQMVENPDQEVKLHDIYGKLINLGVQPRLIFAGEESAGMIIGPEDLIKSNKGRAAVSMREKSAAEASVIATAMAADLHKKNMTMSEYTEEIFKEYDIKWKYDVRIDRRLYNESNPDPIALKKEKAEGEIVRDKVDDFYLCIALSLKFEKITFEQAREILEEALPELDFSNLENIHFVGDGTYLKFKDKYIEIRKSGTDAILKGYAAGADKKNCIEYAQKMSDFSGDPTPKYKELIDTEIIKDCQQISLDLLREFQKKV